VRVKICGITSLADALFATEAGADALGLMFFDGSPRRLTLEEGAKIARALPPFVSRVGVFVDPEPDFVRLAVKTCSLNLIQLHGNESPEFSAQMPANVIKAFRVAGPESLGAMKAYQTQAWLLDSYVPGQLGGTGEKFNWDLALEAKKWGTPIVLAGGLTPENVAAAIKKVQPYAVDVSSGVESAPGKKDHQKVRDFIAAAKQGSR